MLDRRKARTGTRAPGCPNSCNITQVLTSHLRVVPGQRSIRK